MATLDPRIVTLRDGRTATIRSGDELDALASWEFGRRELGLSDQVVTRPDEYPADVDVERERIVALRDDPNALLLFAFSPVGELVGSMRFFTDKRRRARHAGQFGLLVVDSWRGVGLGRVLIEVLIEWARTHAEIEKICLGVFHTNPLAYGLYQRMGFIEEGRQRGHFKLEDGTRIDEILMALWVK